MGALLDARPPQLGSSGGRRRGRWDRGGRSRTAARPPPYSSPSEHHAGRPRRRRACDERAQRTDPAPAWASASGVPWVSFPRVPTRSQNQPSFLGVSGAVEPTSLQSRYTHFTVSSSELFRLSGIWNFLTTKGLQRSPRSMAVCDPPPLCPPAAPGAINLSFCRLLPPVSPTRFSWRSSFRVTPTPLPSSTDAMPLPRSRWPRRCASGVSSPRRSFKRPFSPAGALVGTSIPAAAASGPGCSGSRAIAPSTSCARTSPPKSPDAGDRRVEDFLEASDRTDGEVRRREHARELLAALDDLPPEQSCVITLAYYGGYTHTEIATMLDTPIGTVKGRMRLGLRKMAGSVPPPG